MENKELINDLNNNVNEYIRNIKENIDEKNFSYNSWLPNE